MRTVVTDVSVGGETELREQIAMSCRILYRLGLVDYLGHVSARSPTPGQVLISARRSTGVHGLDSITADNVVAIDFDGDVVQGEEPPVERFIHTEIYRARPGVRAVVHTHQPMATLVGIVDLPILPILHISSPLVERLVPTYPCAKLIVGSQLGQELARALGDHEVCHLQGHGIVSVAPTVPEATILAIMLEQLAETNFRAAQIGRPPRVIPPDEIDQLKLHRAPLIGRWRYYVELVGG